MNPPVNWWVVAVIVVDAFLIWAIVAAIAWR